eukprot:3719399-Pyramimonas_sp.AAC.1
MRSGPDRGTEGDPGGAGRTRRPVEPSNGPTRGKEEAIDHPCGGGHLPAFTGAGDPRLSDPFLGREARPVAYPWGTSGGRRICAYTEDTAPSRHCGGRVAGHAFPLPAIPGLDAVRFSLRAVVRSRVATEGRSFCVYRAGGSPIPSLSVVPSVLVS